MIFSIALAIGIYSYLIFLIGLLNLLYLTVILFVSFIFFITAALTFRKIHRFSSNKRKESDNLPLDLVEKAAILILLIAFGVIFVGVLSPELAFDSLWYHLTLPKLYVENHAIFFIPGGLLYYSAMPKLAEVLYTVGLFLADERLAKGIHFGFGILTVYAIYAFLRQYSNRKYALLAVIIFLSNIVVLWEATTAYIDLARSFFEFTSLWALVIWFKTREEKWFIESAALLGLAISTKLLAAGSLIIIAVLLVVCLRSAGLLAVVKRISLYFAFSLLIASPYLIFSYLHTGNPIYPFFSPFYPIDSSVVLLNPFTFIQEITHIFTRAADPLSPLYFIMAPLILLLIKNLTLEKKIFIIYTVGAIVVWYITPRTGGGRFLLPYLPVFSVLLAFVLYELRTQRFLHTFIVTLVLLSASIAVAYRGVASMRYLPVIMGKESREEFLQKNLRFSYGDFYDIDGYFAKKIGERDKVLLYGFHNLYYVQFPFIHESWVKKGDTFNYIATQNTALPARFNGFDIIYANPTTHVTLYTKGGRFLQY